MAARLRHHQPSANQEVDLSVQPRDWWGRGRGLHTSPSPVAMGQCRAGQEAAHSPTSHQDTNATQRGATQRENAQDTPASPRQSPFPSSTRRAGEGSCTRNRCQRYLCARHASAFHTCHSVHMGGGRTGHPTTRRGRSETPGDHPGRIRAPGGLCAPSAHHGQGRPPGHRM